jgi:uroporphyrinogen decarboxylase
MVHTVLEKATAFLIEYAKAYKAAGANGIIMAEPVAGLLSPALEEEFSSPYVRQIVEAVQDDSFIVIYHNCGDNVLRMTESIRSTGADAYHFGNSIDMADMMARMPADVPVMGNVDPAGVLRQGTPETVRETTLAVMEKCCAYPNFVISSGCDIPPATPWENIEAFFAAVEEYYGNASLLCER